MALQAASFSPTTSVYKDVCAAGTVVLKDTGLSGVPFSVLIEVKSKSLILRNKVICPYSILWFNPPQDSRNVCNINYPSTYSREDYLLELLEPRLQQFQKSTRRHWKETKR